MGNGNRHAQRFQQLQGLVTGAADLLFPPLCLLCEVPLAAHGGICSDCLQGISLLASPLCPLCGREMRAAAGGDHLCGVCLREKPPYSSARALAHYQEPVTTLLHRLKYQGDSSVLPALREIISSTASVSLGTEDRVVPVPLHGRRLRQRGFNQAILLARLFFPERKESILVDCLQRISDTEPQTGLDGAARRKNLRKAFTVRNAEQVRGREVMLVDDVFTTGTTVSECSRALLAAGAGKVHILTLARVRN